MTQGGLSWNITIFPKKNFIRVDLMQVIFTQGVPFCIVFKFTKDSLIGVDPI